MKRLFLPVLLILLAMLICTAGCNKPEKTIKTLDDAKSAKIGVMIGTTGEQISRFSSPDDFKDKRIGVIMGTTHDVFATRAYPQATIMRYKSPSDMLLGVRSGKVDAGIYSREELADMMGTNGELGIVGGSLFDTPVGFGFNKNNVELRQAFDRFLKEIRLNGQYDDMVKRWVTDAGTAMPQLPKPPEGKKLVAGIISDNGLPFTILKDNRLIGFNIEMMERFGAFIGRPVEYQDMEFGSLIAAAATGKIDMIATILGITEERKKQIAFSDPYYELGAYFFALKKNIASPDNLQKPSDVSGLQAFFKHATKGFHSNILHEKRYLLILDGLKTTVVISVLSTIFGTMLGGIICFMRMSHHPLLSNPAKLYISILRGTPVLVLLMLIYYVVFASINISPILVAVIAFGMNFGAYTSEIFRTGIEGIDSGQTEAGISLGFTRTGAFLQIVLPQMIRGILPVYKGEFISLVKMTSIVGYIAVQDLTKAGDIIRSRTFDAFFPLVMIAVLYFGISWALMQGLTWLEQSTDPKTRREKGGLK